MKRSSGIIIDVGFWGRVQGNEYSSGVHGSSSFRNEEKGNSQFRGSWLSIFHFLVYSGKIVKTEGCWDIFWLSIFHFLLVYSEKSEN